MQPDRRSEPPAFAKWPGRTAQMWPDMERPDALASATGRVEGTSRPVGTAENSPDTPEAQSATSDCVASPSLSELAAGINKMHDRANASAKSALESAIEAGHLLIQAKAQVGHGGWLPW